MALVNSCVLAAETKRILLNWTILRVEDEAHTVGDFFMKTVKPRLSYECGNTPQSIYVGPDKNSLDHVSDGNLPVVLLVKSFGRFLMYHVAVDHSPLAIDQESEASGSGRGQSCPPSGGVSLDTICIPERNKKDKLFNAIIGFLSDEGVFLDELSTSESKSVKQFVGVARDILWYVDGHHHVFSERALSLPAVFTRFTQYNTPHLSKHRKRCTSNISADQLNEFSLDLSSNLHSSFWEKPQWKRLKHHFLQLSESLCSYSEYLSKKAKRMKLYHESPTPVREISENLKLKLLPPAVLRVLPSSLVPLDDVLRDKPDYQYEALTHLFPSDSVQKHRFMDTVLSTGLSCCCVLLVYSPGSNIGNQVYAWNVPEDVEPCLIFERSQSVVEEIKVNLPIYHSRAMRAAMFAKFGRVSSAVKPAILRYFYKDLTGDQSASTTTDQAQVDARVHEAIDMEDPSIVLDLRSLNTSEAGCYDVFWSECQKFLAEDISPAVDDRRHGHIAHLSRAISIRDFVEQVQLRCPAGTKIPSLEWVRLQFWPKTPSAKASLHYTGQFQMKFMVQQRQWRRQHPDCHYAAATFRYMREYALLLRDHCSFICLDDKHKVKVGEPGFPVASAERGRRVPVRLDEFFMVGDHDFTKFTLIPSVTFVLDIPEKISGSWYSGTVYVGLKDAVFEASSPLRHACELYQTLQSFSFSKSVLFLYSDGGSDHRLTYVSVQLSLICLFIKLDLDYLCAGRTAPYHSWRNPVERIMSVLNLGLQCIGLARDRMPDEFEKEVEKCNNLTELRNIASRKSDISSAVQDSLSPVKILLTTVFSRLKLHENYIKFYASASSAELDEFWSAVISIDATLQEKGKYRKEDLKDHSAIAAFIAHCCQCTQYTFDILKCAESSCTICKPVRLSPDIFRKISHIPHPVLGEDNHYKPFTEVLGTKTKEECPSLDLKKKKNSLPFTGCLQHVKNSGLVIQCSECEMWRLVFSKYKLKPEELREIQLLLDDYTYTCGSKLVDLLPEKFCNVEIRDHSCYDITEKLYYSAKYAPICVYCGKDEPFTDSAAYPQCTGCINKPKVKK